MVSAAYAPEEQALLRQRRDRVDEREYFKVKRDLEAYYVPVHRHDLTYERVSLHWMATNMGTELAWRARYLVIERKAQVIDTDPWLRPIHPAVFHAQYVPNGWVRLPAGALKQQVEKAVEMVA